MSDAPPTRPSLLLRLRDFQDRQAWEQFVDLYTPLLFHWALRLGRNEAGEFLRNLAGSMRQRQFLL